MKKAGLIISKAECKTVRAPLVMPFRIATGQHNELENVFLAVELQDGVKGFGEAAVATHITGETVEQTVNNLRAAAAALKGQDISDPFALCRAVKPEFRGNHAALAALETAVLDAFTRSFKVPLWKLFGDRPAQLSTDITVVIGSVEEAAGVAEDFYRRGFRAFKIKVGNDANLDLQRVLAVAKHAPRSALILDANQGFTAETMLKFLKALRAKGVTPVLLEQPVPKADLDGLKKLTRLSGVLVCADESAGSLKDVTRLLQENVVNAVNVKFMKSGLIEGAEIARLARAKGAKLMIGAMLESALSITAAAHFAAGLGCFDFIDLDTTFFIRGPLSRSPYLDAQGRFDLSNAGAGIGVALKI
jgi:L-alanine-DL-glutamate epimerase-like enolase superfamily enzyme